MLEAQGSAQFRKEKIHILHSPAKKNKQLLFYPGSSYHEMYKIIRAVMVGTDLIVHGHITYLGHGISVYIHAPHGAIVAEHSAEYIMYNFQCLPLLES